MNRFRNHFPKFISCLGICVISILPVAATAQIESGISSFLKMNSIAKSGGSIPARLRPRDDTAILNQGSDTEFNLVFEFLSGNQNADIARLLAALHEVGGDTLLPPTGTIPVFGQTGCEILERNIGIRCNGSASEIMMKNYNPETGSDIFAGIEFFLPDVKVERFPYEVEVLYTPYGSLNWHSKWVENAQKLSIGKLNTRQNRATVKILGRRLVLSAKSPMDAETILETYNRLRIANSSVAIG